MAKSADSIGARIVFAAAVLVFLVAVGWTVNSAVTAYESHRQGAAAAKTATGTPGSAAAPRPPTGPAPPASGSQRPLVERIELERARLERELEESRARLEAERKAAEGSGAGAEAPVRAGGAVTPPVRIGGPDPAYTAEALAQRVQGVVILEAIIESDGQVSSTRVLKGLSSDLDQSARAAVAQWQFAPATQDGQPVRAIYTLTINFRLP